MRYFLFLICLFPFHLNAQTFVDFEYKDNNTKCKCKKNSSVQKILDTLHMVKDERFLACCYHCIGYYYYNHDEFLRAIPYKQKALQIREKSPDNLLWKSYRNLGYAYTETGYYNKAVHSILSGFKVDDKFRKNSTAYVRLGESYLQLGEFENAITALESAVKYENSDYQLAQAYNSLCIALTETKDSLNLIKAIEHAEKAIKLFESEEDIERVAAAYTNKGNAHDWLNQHELAVQDYGKAKEIYLLEKDTLNLARTLNNIATTLYLQGKHHKAIEKLNRSVELKKKYYRNDNYQYTYAANHENLAENYEALNDFDKALEHYQLALQNLTDNFRNQDINTNPKTTDNYIYNKPDLLRVLDLKAQATLKSGNIDLAYDIYRVLDKWITEFYKDLSTKESKLTWIARAHTIYGNAIDVALMKGKQEKAFEYAEKAHAVLLWQSLSQQAARNLLSEEDKEKIDDLTVKIRQADQQYRYDEITIDVLRTLENEQRKLEQAFEDKYPQYKKRKYQIESTTVAQIQNMIDENTAFIEYYQTDKTLYIFTITKNKLQITEENANGLTDDITGFVNNISGKSGIKNEGTLVTTRSNNPVNPENTDMKNYHTLAHKLYKQLIPVAVRSNGEINRLVIVPDHKIGMLPFAALTTQVTSGAWSADLPFLIQKYTVNYLYSAGSYLQLQQKEAAPKYCFAGIAPIEYTHGNWQELPNSEDELNEIKALHWWWNRDILIREKATKAEFERIIKEGYRTIQISTHAVFDENKGRIIFHDNAFNQNEIDQLEINTHRLILSACETGVGIQNQGEGILSLGWNFAYKGVPSITMSHWSVSDVATQKIMISYHKNLNDGIHADQALQKAQQYYLKNISRDKFAHPYYWAAFFHTGNTR